MTITEVNQKNYTKIDSHGRLRSFVQFNCQDCKNETHQRLDEFHRKGALCRMCKRRRQSIKEFKTKNIDVVCATTLLSRLKKRYLFKGLTSNLTVDETLNLFKSECHYCGIKNSNKFIYKQPHFSHIFYYNGIDRIDSKKGYIRGNVVSCCKRCNIAKSDLPYNEFIELIKRINAHLLLRK